MVVVVMMMQQLEEDERKKSETGESENAHLKGKWRNQRQTKFLLHPAADLHQRSRSGSTTRVRTRKRRRAARPLLI